MIKKTKVLFYIQNLNGGGAERSIVELIKQVDLNLFEYKLLLDNPKGKFFDNVPTDNILNTSLTLFNKFSYYKIIRLLKINYSIKILNIIKNKIKYHVFKYVLKNNSKKFSNNEFLDKYEVKLINMLYLNSVISFLHFKKKYKPDIIVSSLIETGSAIVFFARLWEGDKALKTKWISIEQNNTNEREKTYYTDDNERAFWHKLTMAIYKDSDEIIAVSEGVKKGLVDYYNLNKKKINVIHNQASSDIAKFKETNKLIHKNSFILASGRLHVQKGFDILIKAYSLIYNKIDEDLLIIGSGIEKDYLLKLIQSFNLNNRIYILEFKDNIWEYMKKASCFVLSSRFEGFPLVILEAMACGCPVISFNCNYGPEEIIDNNINGILVPNEDYKMLAIEIERLLKDSNMKIRLSKNGLHKVSRYNSDAIAKEYENIFSKNLIKEQA